MNKITIIIPVYNDEDIIEKTINKLYNQTYKDWKLLLINDGSTDKTYKIIKKISKKKNNITVIKQNNKGPSSSRNLGLLFLETKYSVFLDSDDEWNNEFLETMYKVIENTDKETGLVYCNTQIYVNGRIGELLRFPHYNYNELFNSTGKIATGSFIFKSEIIIKDKIFFDEEIPRGEDFEWQLRVGKKYKFKHVDKTLHYYYRESTGQLMNNNGIDAMKIINRKKEKI